MQEKLISPISWISQKTGPPNKPNRYLTPRGYNLPVSKERYNLPSFFQRVTDVLFDGDNIPDQILATYSDDYDILHIHDILLCKLDQEKNELSSLQHRKEETRKRLEEQLKIVERKKLEKQLDEISSRIDLIVSEERKKKYMEESKDYIYDYQRLGPIIRMKSFLDDETMKKDLPDYEERLDIIRGYLDVAKKYIPINIIRIIPNDRSCPGCGKDLVLVDPGDHSIERCDECGFEKLNFAKSSFFKETSSQSKSISNSDYEDRENFIKALECYLGEQQPPPASLFLALETWAAKYEHPSKDLIQTFPFNEDGTRGEYGKSMLLQALADEGYADYYKDVKLIGHLHWGWKLPSVTQQERDLVIQDYDTTQHVFNAIPKERKSSLNTQYRLYRHLQARKISCQPTDFKLPTTPNILEEQDNYWREMVKVIPGAEFTSLK